MACTERVAFTRFTCNGMGHAAEFPLGLELLGLLDLTACVENVMFVRLAPRAAEVLPNCPGD